MANRGGNSITVYTRTADGNAAPLRTLQVNHTGLLNPSVSVVTTTGAPFASVTLNDVSFVTGQTIAYQGTLAPGVAPN